MDVPDIASSILSLLDNASLGKIYVLGLIPILSWLQASSLFWHSRVETLAGRRIAFDCNLDWKWTYQLLILELVAPHPRFYNREDNVIVLQILSSFGHEPTQTDVCDAAGYGKPRILKWLLNHARIPEFSGDFEDPPLVLAAKYGRDECVDLLLDDRKGVRRWRLSAIDGAQRMRLPYNKDRYAKILTMLLDLDRCHGMDEEYINVMYCSITMCGDDPDKVRLALDRIISIPELDMFVCVRGAMARSSLKVIRVLMSDPRVRLRVGKERVISIAIHKGWIRSLEVLLEYPYARAQLRQSDIALAERFCTRLESCHILDLIRSIIASRWEV